MNQLLNGLILGESLLNDAMALVMCRSIEEYFKLSQTEGEQLEVTTFFMTVLTFITVFVGSIVLGSLCGTLTSLFTKFTQIGSYPLLETSLFFLVSFSSYLLAEVCEFSGIVSVLFCGIFQAHYTQSNLSSESKQRTHQLAEILNFLAENFIFCYLGVSMFTFMKHKFNYTMIFGSFIAIAVGRFFMVYPISFLLNLGRTQKIPLTVSIVIYYIEMFLLQASLTYVTSVRLKYQHMIWFTGLRGAIAFAISIQNTTSEVRQIFFTNTCIIVIVTVFINGAATSVMLSFLKVNYTAL